MSHHLSYLNLEKPLLLTDSDKVKNSWTMELSSMDNQKIPDNPVIHIFAKQSGAYNDDWIQT